MIRPLLVIVLACFSFIPIKAQMQTEKAAKAQFGITDAQLINQMMIALPNVSGNTRNLLNQQSVKANMMPVRSAKRNAEELSYIMAGCLEYYYNLGKNYKLNLSPDFIRLSLNNTSASFREVFTFLAENGTVSAAILPYGSKALTQAVYATQKYKIRNYLHVFRTTTRSRQKAYEVRKALMRGHPVIIELAADESIFSHASSQKYLESAKNPSRNYPLVVVGFDETLEAFELMSCWGRDWGDNGYIWISYDDFGKFAQNGYVLAPDVDF